MDPPPAHPLYVVAQRQHLLYLVERQEFEEHGLDKPNGVVMILSDALNWRFARPYGRGQNDDEPFMDAERFEHASTIMGSWLTNFLIGHESLLRTYAGHLG